MPEHHNRMGIYEKLECLLSRGDMTLHDSNCDIRSGIICSATNLQTIQSYAIEEKHNTCMYRQRHVLLLPYSF